ncbi:hypothetical protein JZ751_016102 [Albula glossodonta]|uniref:protein-tyrosine-phosphatase n=1 Tax=Albula glossodonta TaxID=121402 RepID=A0A8T2NQL8_9TELE|nr:hypothetical protein JZ751_016102 [Albula glossodonta]
MAPPHPSFTLIGCVSHPATLTSAVVRLPEHESVQQHPECILHDCTAQLPRRRHHLMVTEEPFPPAPSSHASGPVRAGPSRPPIPASSTSDPASSHGRVPRTRGPGALIAGHTQAPGQAPDAGYFLPPQRTDCWRDLVQGSLSGSLPPNTTNTPPNAPSKHCKPGMRGSNVSLVLDMSALGAVEPLSSVVATPRERATMEYLQSAGRTLSRQQLRDTVNNTQTLHAEFVEIPMNFVDPKELDIPSHGTKNRYKTILPNPHSRVILKTKNIYDPLSSYINANYIRGYLGDEKTYIATQGPMINTVNDFWQMTWQEDCPVIVMITKLKEKNEKCVLYWPEKRGIYGKVEVLINSMKECEHYTIRNLTVKLMSDVEEDRLASGSRGPVIVHCSAGIGRTGCFIATTIGCRQLQQEGVVDVLGIVCQLRVDRGGMIQTGEQYEFVHHALSLYESRLSADAGQ